MNGKSTDVPRASSPPEGERDLLSGKSVGGNTPASRGEYESSNINHARSMRKKMTPQEFQLWNCLKNAQLKGYKFRRQQPVGAYIVDFLNTEKRLVIELDGSQHANNASDVVRDEYLKRAGYTVLRFWNNEIDRNLEGVLTRILERLTASPPRMCASAHPAPPQGGSYPVAPFRNNALAEQAS